MQLFRAPDIPLCLFVLTTAVLSRSFITFIAEKEEKTTRLENRQITGVIGTSQFLRRIKLVSNSLSNALCTPPLTEF